MVLVLIVEVPLIVVLLGVLTFNKVVIIESMLTKTLKLYINIIIIIVIV